jgi:hypothetical protein
MISPRGKELYTEGDCRKGKRNKGGPLDGQLVRVAFFTSGYIGCPIIGKCGDLCTAFYFEIKKE